MRLSFYIHTQHNELAVLCVFIHLGSYFDGVIHSINIY